MRLTTDLIKNSLSYLNPLKERELNLRELVDTCILKGHKIPAIENLGAAKDHEAIDFTDNDIVILGNFPLSPRLQTLLCASNRISSIQPNLAKSLPKLHTLVLTQNNIGELADLDPLQGFARLTHVSLIDNPVASKEHYRYYVLWRAPQIRFLDFQKVKDAERERAKELFGTFEAPTELAKSIAETRSKNPLSYAGAETNGAGKRQKIKLTEKERARFEALVKDAKNLTEVRKLEKALLEGRLPPGVADDAMDET